MSNSIRQIMAKAYKNVLSNPREAKFAWRMQRMFKKSETRRKEVLIQEGLEVPPLLISSIAGWNMPTSYSYHSQGMKKNWADAWPPAAAFSTSVQTAPQNLVLSLRSPMGT